MAKPSLYSVGLAHLGLAGIADGQAERERHVAAAREVWTGIGRDDLVAELDGELGNDAD